MVCYGPESNHWSISKTHFFSYKTSATTIAETSHCRNVPSPKQRRWNSVAETASPKCLRPARAVSPAPYFSVHFPYTSFCTPFEASWVVCGSLTPLACALGWHFSRVAKKCDWKIITRLFIENYTTRNKVSNARRAFTVHRQNRQCYNVYQINQSICIFFRC